MQCREGDRENGGQVLRGYTDLAKKYLYAGKLRCVVTIIGVAITVMVLYGGLDLAYSWLLAQRESVREQYDYEFVIMAESREQAYEIAADDRIVKAYVGEYEYVSQEKLDELIDSAEMSEDGGYDVDLEDAEVLCKNAVYATGKNPYSMSKTMSGIAADYGVQGELSSELGYLYFQGEDDLALTSMIVYVLLILLVAYVLAVIAIGMIRNTIQMFLLEQIKDYGILRCVGATKRQLRAVIYRMSLTMEIAGIVGGVTIGGAAAMIIALFLGVSAGFHLIPILPVLVCYLGDLCFMVHDVSRNVTGMSPISAVRGEYRIRKEKIRTRGRGLMGLIFGLEGDYARKSVLRNKGRFIRSVSALTFSIAVTTAAGSMLKATDSMIDVLDSSVGQYQVTLNIPPGILYTVDDTQQMLVSEYDLTEDRMAELTGSSAVLEARKIYCADVMLENGDDFVSMFTDEAFGSSYAYHIGFAKDLYDEELKTLEAAPTDDTDIYGDEKSDRYRLNQYDCLYSAISMYGMSQDELNTLGKYLVQGTLDLSENGIIVCSGGGAYDVSSEGTDLVDIDVEHMDFMNCELGDEINIVDTELFNERVWKIMSELEASESDCYRDGEDKYTKWYDVAVMVREELIAEGHYKTYVVEGIIDMEDDYADSVGIYTSLDNYLSETGFTENQISGVKYKIDSHHITLEQCEELDGLDGMSYIYYLEEILNLKKWNGILLLAALFVFSLGAVGIINYQAGDIRMRRLEFAQLRVIGMSKKRLIKTVSLEGLMALVPSGILGAAIGSVGYWYEYYLMNIQLERSSMRGFSLSAVSIAAGILMSALLVFGSIILSLRSLPNEMAEDLTLSD